MLESHWSPYIHGRRLSSRNFEAAAIAPAVPHYPTLSALGMSAVSQPAYEPVQVHDTTKGNEEFSEETRRETVTQFERTTCEVVVTKHERPAT